MPADNEKRDNLIKNYSSSRERILELVKDRNELLHYRRPITERKISDSIEDEKRRIENKGLAQDQDLKKWTLWILLMFLALETMAIFTFTFFQAVYWHGFKLDEWSFKLLVTATISQITVMLIIAVKHLFPNK